MQQIIDFYYQVVVCLMTGQLAVQVQANLKTHSTKFENLVSGILTLISKCDIALNLYHIIRFTWIQLMEELLVWSGVHHIEWL